MADFQNKVVITNEGRAAIANMLDTGTPSIQISHFAIGTGGYMPSNPTVVIPPNAAATTLINEIYRSNNVGRESISNSIRTYVGKITPGDAVGAIGEFGLFATYLTGDKANTSENVFLFAIMHTPMKSLTPEDSYTFRIPVIL